MGIGLRPRSISNSFLCGLWAFALDERDWALSLVQMILMGFPEAHYQSPLELSTIPFGSGQMKQILPNEIKYL